MNENSGKIEKSTMNRSVSERPSGDGNRGVGNVCETPRVIELGYASEPYCYNDKDFLGQI
ncbi:MAG: hypothetical protein NT061_09030 [Spirochaetes bacterium]|nr:hypothetical protein [Spirochaetota bacterium]